MSDLVQLVDPEARFSPVRKREPGPRPDWLRVTYRRNERFAEVRALKDGLGLVTVCEEARCPNIDECWSASFNTIPDTKRTHTIHNDTKRTHTMRCGGTWYDCEK